MPRFVAATTFVRYTRPTLLTGSLLHSPSRFRLASTMSIPSKMKACQIREQGELDVIQVTEVDVPQPAKGQVLYEVQWAGVNFIDTYQRGGLYKLAMPYILGNESAGVVIALGEGVTEASHGFKIGDKVAAYTAGGAFAEYAVSLADKTVKIPESMSTKQAATGLLQGLTALTFIREAHPVRKGEHILVQAAAGGLGGLLVQLAKSAGAHVIGTTSTEEKAKIARASGADHVILYSGQVDVAEEVYKITGGEGIDRGVHAVFDGVGKDTFEMDFDLVRRKGSIVSCGNASGAVPPFSVLKLGPKNLKLIRPVLNQYVHTKHEFQTYSTELFGLLASGQLRLSVHSEYPLSTKGIKQAQVDIMGRKSSGKLLIKVAQE
ncbi:BQ5605_C003g02044 [Microbotryum silenes-dioicae]|uniref:Probable quinone oxidoreductase n=1 Tax=Microbotryum silenes-dioicae TaxID=796604 RepID=A0A2X0M436_9BASI|nr:BQ5605_C003g02044 [Microbotryum silenes-dioicae]